MDFDPDARRHSNNEMRTQPKTALHSARRYLLLAKAQGEASEECLFMRLELRQNLQTLLLTAANGTRTRSQPHYLTLTPSPSQAPCAMST